MGTLFCIEVQLKRKYEYWLYNVIVLLASISSVVFATFALEPNEIGERLSLILTLLLTSVAFKFVISDAVPKVSYMTVLDTYVLVCNALFFMVAIGTTAMPFLVDDPQQFEMSWLVPALLAFWIGFHALFAGRVMRWNTLIGKVLGTKMPAPPEHSFVKYKII